MAAKYILAVLACVFAAAGLLARPHSRTYLLVSGVFAGVSLWLFVRT
jgi:hypothetical protein